MKKLMSMVLVLLFILSSLVFTNSFYVDELRTASSQAVLHKTVNTGIDTIVSEINSVVPIDQKESVEVLKTKIETDPLVNSMIDKYSLIVLHDLSNNDSETSINEDVHLALDTYTKEIADLTGDVISPQYREVLVKELVNRIDFDEIYHQKLGSLKENVSPNQMKLIKIMDYLFTNLNQIQQYSLGIAVLSLIAIIVVNLKDNRYFNTLAIALFLAAIADGLSRIILNYGLNKYASSLNINVDLPVFSKFTFIMIALAITSKIIGHFVTETSA